MTLTLIVILIIAGLMFVMLEILVMPGTGIVGILGGAMIVFAIISAYGISSTHGHIALAGSMILSALTIYLSVKSNTWQRISLSNSIEGKVNVHDEKIVKPGDTGLATSRLNPVGKAVINDIIYEVESVEGYIPENREIEVVKVSSHKIRVKSKTITI
jgi:membrane-bound ClpP family serine protease